MALEPEEPRWRGQARRGSFVVVLVFVVLAGAAGSIVWRARQDDPGWIPNAALTVLEWWKGRPGPAAPAATPQEPSILREKKSSPDVVALLGDRRTLVVVLAGTGAVPDATGRVIWHPEFGGFFAAFGLISSPPGSTYYVWARPADGRDAMALARFMVDADGTAQALLLPSDVSEPAGFLVTLERSETPLVPSGVEYLLGETASRRSSSTQMGHVAQRESAGSEPTARGRPGVGRDAGRESSVARPPAERLPGESAKGRGQGRSSSAPNIPPSPPPGPRGAEGKADLPAEPPTTAPRPRPDPSVASIPPPSEGTDHRGIVPTPVVGIVSVPPPTALAASEAALRELGWEIDRDASDPVTGVLATESRPVNYKQRVVYAEGTRHRLFVSIRPLGDGRVSISVIRDLYEEERILWIRKWRVLPVPDSSVETTVLDAIRRLL